MSKTPIVVSGSIAIDRIMNFDGRFRDSINQDKIDSISLSLFIQNLQDAHGGVAANTSYSLARLGDEPILLGCIGQDALLYMEKLAHNGVNISHVFESNLPTATFTVFTDGEQNQIGGFYPGAMFDSDSLGLETWKDKNPIVVVMAHDPKAMLRQIHECRDWNLRLCYIPGQQVSNLPGEDLREGVLAATVLIANDYEVSVISKKTGLSEKKIKSTVPIVVTTLGKKGSIIEGKDVPEPIHVGVVKPKKAVDPTGAGDAFSAGFVYGYARDWPLKACAQLGATCGTYAIEAAGTQAHSFTVQQITKRYEETFKEPLPGKLIKES